MNDSTATINLLASQWLDQLKRERKAVAALLSILKQIKQALKHHDMPLLSVLIEEQQARMTAMAQTRVHRQRLQARIRNEQPNRDRTDWHDWVQTLPVDSREALTHERERLLESATLAQQQARCNASIVSCASKRLQQAVSYLLGKDDGSERYTAAGTCNQLTANG